MYQECQELKVKILDQSYQEILLEIKQSMQEMKEMKQTMNSLGTEHLIVTENLRELQDSQYILKAEHSKVTAILNDPVPWNIRGMLFILLQKK